MSRLALIGCGIMVLAACSPAPEPAGTSAIGADGQEAAALADTAASDGLALDAPPDDVPPADAATAVDDVAEVADSADATETTDDVADAVLDAEDDASGGEDVISCKPGVQTCQGVQLATCASKGDGWIVSKCFPGMACIDGGCKAVSNNIILIFDTSGSMSATVNKKGSSVPLCSGSDYNKWPTCEDTTMFPDGCTRIGVSKSVFQKALAKLDDQVTHMALMRFPQTGGNCTGGAFSCSCSSGNYNGNDVVKGDVGAQAVTDTSSWFWNNVSDVLCVPFPKLKGDKTKDKLKLWMDQKQDATNPELRATGGTPIGKSLFYAGEYIRNRVIVDGKPCTLDSDCGNANYVCNSGKCKDPMRSCRDTIVVLFTDGGEDSANTYFGPWVQAKRMSMGLGCQSDADCVGGGSCATFKECMPTGQKLGTGVQCNVDSDCIEGGKSIGTCKPFQQCMPTAQVTGYFCSQGGAPCLPSATPTLPGGSPNPSFCAGQCTKDPRIRLTVTATNPADNVLRSPDGKPFGVRLYVVDIGSTTASDIQNSMGLAISGGGKLLGADASDPQQFLGALDAAFDLKNKNICGLVQ